MKEPLPGKKTYGSGALVILGPVIQWACLEYLKVELPSEVLYPLLGSLTIFFRWLGKRREK